MGVSKSSLRGGQKPNSGEPPTSGEDVDALAKELAGLKATGTNVDYDLLQMDLRMQQQLAEIDGCELADEEVAEEDLGGEDELLEMDEDELRELEAEMEELERSMMPDEQVSPAIIAATPVLISEHFAFSAISSPAPVLTTKKVVEQAPPADSRPQESSPRESNSTTTAHGKMSSHAVLNEEDSPTSASSLTSPSVVVQSQPGDSIPTQHVAALLVSSSCGDRDIALLAEGVGSELLEPEVYTFPMAS